MTQHIPIAYTNLASHPQHMLLSFGKITSEQSAIKFVGKVHFHFVNNQPKQKERGNTNGSFANFECVRQKNASLKDVF